MNKKNMVRTAVAAVVLAASLPVFAYTLGGKEIINNGTGTRTKFGMTLYKATLGVVKELKGASETQVIDADQPQVITLNIVSSMITKDKFVSAVNDALDNAAKAGYSIADKPAYVALFSNIKIVKGDSFAHQYEPGKGMTVVYTTGGKTTVLGTVKNLQFKRAFTAMFIGPKPIQDSMKKELLGK
jgi:hypothetical protein